MPESVVLPGTPVPSMAAYLQQEGRPGGRGLETALAMEPDEVVAEVSDAGLRGRGGAGFPTGRKWASVREGHEGDTPVYLVCNAAEGEPGTYKDRAIMSADPYQLVEGICIAIHALDASGAYIGIKEGYAHQRERLDGALAEARAEGWQGAELISVIPGPDEYLFGEEKALLEVIEGKLPMPRILPPYMQGLFATMQSQNPTAVNNVETLAHVAHVLAEGADDWRQVGTAESPGTMVFTVIGDVANPGVYELPMGTSLRTLLRDIAGAEEIKMIVPGVSNAVLTGDMLDLPMDFESFAEAGSGLGSGGFIVYGPDRDAAQVGRTLARFLAIESCGQCNACKLGTAEFFTRFDRVAAGEGGAGDLAQIERTLATVDDANRCYLPVGAAKVLGSLLVEFGDELAATADGSRPAGERVEAPKITDIADGQVILDETYHRKRSDWSYAPG